MGTPTTDRGGVQQTIRALQAAGWRLDSVNDGDSYEPEDGLELDAYGDQIVHTEKEAIDCLMAVDVATLYVTKDGERQWVRFVFGNEPEEVINDYTIGLEDVIGPLIDGWE